VPAMDPARGDVLDELVTMRSTDVELGPVFQGSFTLALQDAPGEELTSLALVEPLAGYWRQVGATFAGGEHML
jgi:acetoacetate decarboxylase